MEVPSVTSAASPSTSLTGSEQLQTEVEVFQVTGTEAPEDTGDDIEPELEELDNLSGNSSEAPCDCPAHVHDRDTPLLIDKVRPTLHYIVTIDTLHLMCRECLRPSDFTRCR